MSARAPTLVATLAVALATSLPACRGCGSHAGVAPASSASAAPAPVFSVGDVAPLAVPELTSQTGVEGVALPSGCTIQTPVREMKRPADSVWNFVAGRSKLDALLMSTERGDSGALGTRGAVDLLRGTVDARIPWIDPDAPPLFDRAPRGWVAAVAAPAGEAAAALLWRQWAAPLDLVHGDQLRVADLACDGSSCAVLTSLARASAVPGATLLYGDPDAGAETWKRIDIQPADDWMPLSLPRWQASSKSGWVALGKSDGAAIYRVEGDHATIHRTDTAAFGVYDAVATRTEPVVIAPGAGRDAPCSAAGFPLILIGAGSKPHSLTLLAPPAGLIARPLSRGAIVAWIAPENCRVAHHTVVHVLLVDDDGTPVGAPMAVTTGTGFALAASGDDISLWIRTDGGITWLRGRCAVAPHD